MNNRINIDIERDTIIVELSDGNNILKGSHLYCGCCGGSMGTLKEAIKFPFRSDELIKKMENVSFEITRPFTALKHSCHHSMFSFGKEWKFITLENYRKQVALTTQ